MAGLRCFAAIALACASVTAGSALAAARGTQTVVVSFSLSGNEIFGSGLLKVVSETPDADGFYAVAPGAGTHSRVTVTRGLFGSKRLTLAVTGGSYRPIPQLLSQQLRLNVSVVASNDAGCPVGTPGTLVIDQGLLHSEHTDATVDVCGKKEELHFSEGLGNQDAGTINELRCTQSASASSRCSRLSKPTPPAPTKVTLTVNGWTLSATTAKPAVYLHHEQDQPLASETALKIRASIDVPLPKGWKLVIYHNGDVLSHGNGDWHKVCEIDSPSTSVSCGETRPGRVGPFDDVVWAAVSAPTYLAMHADVYLHFTAP